MRVIVLTHYYVPENGAPQRRLEAFAVGLRALGHEVVVHTGFPHYPGGGVTPPHRNRPIAVEDSSGLRIVRSLVYPAANRGVARRLLDHTAFAASALLTGRWAGAADVVVVESPPLFLAAAAPLYARQRGARLILHVSDLWPDSVVELGAVTNPFAIAAARRLERGAYRGAARIVAPTAGIVERLEHWPQAAGKVRRIPPAVDLERFAAPPLSRDGPLRVLYAGTVGMAQGVAMLVEAARRAGPDTVSLTVAGAGAELQEVERTARGAANVRVLGAVPAEEVPKLYAEADVAAVLLRDRPLFTGALPTKLFEAMAAGRPLVLAGCGEAARLVERSGAGVVVAPEDPAALAEMLVALAERPEDELRAVGARGVATAADFDRRAMVDRWVALLDELTAVSEGSEARMPNEV
jgi:hypothetical protein